MTKSEMENEKLPSDELGFYVIDGQQRLTTIMILLSLLEKDLTINSDGMLKLLYTFEKDTFRKTLNDVLIDTKYSEPNAYRKKLENAKEFFLLKLKNKNESKRSIKNALLQNFLFTVFVTDNNSKENSYKLAPHVIFESINNRGRQLSKIDIMKNRVFYLQEIIKINYDISSAWDCIFDNLSDIDNTRIEDDDYLLTHYYIFGNDSNIKTKTEVLLQKALDIFQTTNNKDQKKIKNYFHSFYVCSKYWLWIHEPEFFKRDSFKEKINENEFNDINKIFCKLSKLVESNYAKSFIILLIYAYDELKYISISTLISALNFFEKYLYIATFFNSKKLDLATIATKTKNLLYTSQGKIRSKQYFDSQFALTIEELKSEIIEYLDESNMLAWAEKVMKNNCFYCWNGIYYTLYNLNRINSDDTISWDEIITGKSKTIEHIYPIGYGGKYVNKLSKDYWQLSCPDSILEEKDKMINSLGNLILLSNRLNIRASTEMYPAKSKLAYTKGSSLTMTLASKEGICWDYNAIKNRTIKLLEKIQEQWFTNNTNDLFAFTGTLASSVRKILTNFGIKNENFVFKADRKQMQKLWDEYKYDFIIKIINNLENNEDAPLYDDKYCFNIFKLNVPLLVKSNDDKYEKTKRSKCYILKKDRLTKKQINAIVDVLC